MRKFYLSALGFRESHPTIICRLWALKHSNVQPDNTSAHLAGQGNYSFMTEGVILKFTRCTCKFSPMDISAKNKNLKIISIVIIIQQNGESALL